MENIATPSSADHEAKLQAAAEATARLLLAIHELRSGRTNAQTNDLDAAGELTPTTCA